MQDYLGLGSVATAIGLVLTVWAWKMNAHGANWMLALAWVLFSVSVFSIPAIAKQPIMPRSLWTLIVAGLIGLVLHNGLWTELRQSDRPATTSPQVFPNVLVRSLAQLDPSLNKTKNTPGGSYVYMLPYVAFTNNEPTAVSLEVVLRVQNPEKTLREGFGDINADTPRSGWSFRRMPAPMDRLEFLASMDTHLSMKALEFPLNMRPGPGITEAGAIAFFVNPVQMEAMSDPKDPHMRVLEFYLDVSDFQTGLVNSIRVMTLTRGDAKPSTKP